MLVDVPCLFREQKEAGEKAMTDYEAFLAARRRWHWRTWNMLMQIRDATEEELMRSDGEKR